MVLHFYGDYIQQYWLFPQKSVSKSFPLEFLWIMPEHSRSVESPELPFVLNALGAIATASLIPDRSPTEILENLWTGYLKEPFDSSDHSSIYFHLIFDITSFLNLSYWHNSFRIVSIFFLDVFIILVGLISFFHLNANWLLFLKVKNTNKWKSLLQWREYAALCSKDPTVGGLHCWVALNRGWKAEQLWP